MGLSLPCMYCNIMVISSNMSPLCNTLNYYIFSLDQHNFFKRTTDEATNTSKSANASPANIDSQLHSSIPPPISSSSAAASKGETDCNY